MIGICRCNCNPYCGCCCHPSAEVRKAELAVIEDARQALRAIRYTSGVSLDFAGNALSNSLSTLDRLSRGEKNGG